jgi:MFS family permease
MLRPRDEPELEEIEDAVVDGDVAYERGTAQSAFRNRNFRIVYLCTFGSNIGTWMQNVVLGAYALKLTGSAGFVGVIFFAQLGPLLFLSPAGGLLADTVDRRKLLVTSQVTQGLLSFALAAVVLLDQPPQAAIVALVFAIGIANAFGAPGLSAILPTLVPREDLHGAVALQSVQMNLSRVIGPAIGGVLYTAFDAAPVFAINGVTYAFAVVGLMWASYARHADAQLDEHGWRRLLSGVRIARRDPLISHVLITLFSFSFLSLAFVGLMPVLAEDNLGVDPRSTEYGILYACFGLGAALGAITVGTVFAHWSKARLVRPGFVAFAVVLAVFALMHHAAPAYLVGAVLGYAYFVVITALSTVLQEHLQEGQRGRVMALWIMGFGGTVPLGVLVGGWIDEHTGVTISQILLAGAAWALVMAAWSGPKRLGWRSSHA